MPDVQQLFQNTTVRYKSFFNCFVRFPASSSPSSQVLSDHDEHKQSPPISSLNNKTSTKWVPPQLLRDITDRNELIFRQVRGLLNKITPENFDKLSYRLINIGIDKKTVLKGIIILIFEKAIDEQKYSSLYSQLCLKLSHEVPNFDGDSGTNINDNKIVLLVDTANKTFLRLLLNKCQEEFETRSKASSVFDKQDGPLSAEQQEAKQIAKRKMLGNLKFIGELGKLELVQEVILHKCIQQLLAKKKRISLVDMAEDIECLCQIITTVGRRLDTVKAKNIMNQYFDRISKLSESMELPSRIRFMLQDVLELRRNQWVCRRIYQDNGPRSVSQIRWEMMGPMLPPPFPFFPPGMVPPSMLDQMNGMPWLADGMFNGMPPHMKKPNSEFIDDGKDIFGKSVQSAGPVLTNKQPLKLHANHGMFEPHYMKSKGNTQAKSSLTNDLHSKTLGGKKSVEDEKAKNKPLNRSNPWNIDPLAPHYNKSSSILSLNEEVKKNNSPKNNSAPVQLQSSPSPLRHRSQATYKAVKKNDEISLRPVSFLKKKEEKPKSLFAKAEELPPKMQQFTNLTINDKTSSNNKTTKKSALSKADIDKKLSEIWKEYEEPLDLAQIVTSIQSLATNVKYSKMVAKQLLYLAFSKNEDVWNHFAQIFVQCKNEEVLLTYCQLFDDIRVMESTCGKEFMAELAAVFISENMITFEQLADHFQDGRHYPTALFCLSKLQAINSREWVEKMIKSSKIDLKLTFAKENRFDVDIMKEVQEKDLLYLFPHLSLKEDLFKLMKSSHGCTNKIADWIKDNIVGKLEKKQLIHVVSTCMVVLATEETLSLCDINQKPEKELQEKEKNIIECWKSILKDHLGNETVPQLEAIYALQIFCYEKKYPKEMLLRLFIIFYNLEIIEEDIFLQWKEDLNDTYPGKGKALFQVNNWLQWLETADEEDENEDED